MRGTRLLALAAAVAGVAAQPATGTFQITWYEKDACDATGRECISRRLGERLSAWICSCACSWVLRRVCWLVHVIVR